VQLTEHLGAAHPLAHPRLLIDGEIVVKRRTLHHRLPAGSLTLANATELIVSCDGRPSAPWTPAALEKALVNAESLVVEITLINRSGERTAVPETLTLTVAVPNVEDLDEADRCFEEFLAREDLDERWLDRFADATGDLGEARHYATALHQYCVAILIKDQSSGTGTALPFAEHRAKLQRALNVLRNFPERPVARAVCGFIRFSLNDFIGGTSPAGVPRLDECTAALQRAAGLTPIRVEPVAKTAEAGRCPTDTLTGLLLDGWRDPAAQPGLIALAAQGATTPDDATKCRALVLLAAPKWSKLQLDLARSLMNHPLFGPWAARIVEDAGGDD
jgi:hypothetical protein